GGPLPARPVRAAAQRHGTPRFQALVDTDVPAPVERSTYVLLSSLVLLLFARWQALPQTLWSVDNGAACTALHALSGAGWALVFSSTVLINHFELFGLQQAWRGRSEQGEAPPPFITRAVYRIVHHPLMLGFLIAFW